MISYCAHGTVPNQLSPLSHHGDGPVLYSIAEGIVQAAAGGQSVLYPPQHIVALPFKGGLDEATADA